VADDKSANTFIEPNGKTNNAESGKTNNKADYKEDPIRNVPVSDTATAMPEPAVLTWRS